MVLGAGRSRAVRTAGRNRAAERRYRRRASPSVVERHLESNGYDYSFLFRDGRRRRLSLMSSFPPSTHIKRSKNYKTRGNPVLLRETYSVRGSPPAGHGPPRSFDNWGTRLRPQGDAIGHLPLFPEGISIVASSFGRREGPVTDLLASPPRSSLVVLRIPAGHPGRWRGERARFRCSPWSGAKSIEKRRGP